MSADIPDTADSAWPLFLTAHAVLIQAIERSLQEAGLPPLAWYDVLWTLERRDGRLRMHELADLVVLTRSNLTRLVDRLAAAGLVARERDDADRRGAYARLTAQGQALRARMWPVYRAGIDALFDAYASQAERAAMAAVLRRILAGAHGAAMDLAPDSR